MDKNKKVVILANGLFPGSQRTLSILGEAELVICCDGAADKLIAFGRIPDIIVGDLDSLSDEHRKKYEDRLIRSDDQESNDLTKAARYCISKAYKSVCILGATGLREDHSISNVSLLTEYHPELDVRMVTDFGEFFLVKGGSRIPSTAGEQISIFSIDNKVLVSSEGLKYPLDKLQLSNWRTASLNEALGDAFVLHFEATHPLIVYRAF